MAHNPQSPQGPQGHDPAGSTQMFRAFVDEPGPAGQPTQATQSSGPRVGLIVGVVAKLTSYYFTDVAAAYVLAIVVTAGFFLSSFLGNKRREAAGVPSRPVSETIARTV
ncbi:hypothetical protein ACWGLZ_31595, partial [Streptomyces albidoflavus]